MRTYKFYFVLFLLVCFCPREIFGQNISVQNLIGKTKSDVIKIYGNPVHQDNSDPAMMCWFYQDKTTRMIFVSNKEGVYQSEATVSYTSESSARNAVDKLISNSINDGYKVDTISAGDFQIHKPGVKSDLQISENKITKNFVVSVKAKKSEEQ